MPMRYTGVAFLHRRLLRSPLMSEHELSEDLSQWPGDPFALLGVPVSSPEREARRAYIRLIKRFKPDHHPAHFQRIREAYEFVQRQIEIRDKYGDFVPDDDSRPWPDETADEVSSSTTPETSGETGDVMPVAEVIAQSSYTILHRTRNESPPVQSKTDQAAELWQQALAGQPAEAYAGLVRLANETTLATENAASQTGQLYARLYWLLTIDPKLDNSRTPCDWLTAGLRTTRLLGPLSELYRREIVANPYEALTPRCTELLSAGGAARGLSELLGWRWQAATSLSRADIILSDLSSVRSRLIYDDEAAWGQTLLHAVELLAWASGPPELRQNLEATTKSLLAELEQLSHLHQELSEGYDRLDMLIEVSRTWRDLLAAGDVPQSWVEVIPLAWTRPFAELRGKLLSLLSSFATYPLRALRTMDAINDRNPAAVAQLGMLIHRLQYEEAGADEPDERPWEEALRLADAFFRQKPGGPYHQWRASLLEFCLDEGIEPGELTAAMDELLDRFQAAHDSLQDAVRNDGPLRYVYAGVQAFWA